MLQITSNSSVQVFVRQALQRCLWKLGLQRQEKVVDILLQCAAAQQQHRLCQFLQADGVAVPSLAE